ncbi:MAG: hypothetical protein V4706_10795 [Pseudomonadota bacterium]
MAIVPSSGALLAHDKVDRFRPFGAFGKPAYQSHVQLRAMLVSRLGKPYADYFARPVYAPDTGDLRWLAECPGVQHQLEDMDEAARARALASTERIHSALRDTIDRLRAEGGNSIGGASAYASLLEQALKVPREGKHLHYVGEQPVLSFWGFETQQGQSLDPVSRPTESSAAGLAATPLAADNNAGRKKRAWWWWLLWPLLLILLLLLLAVGLRACADPSPPAPLPPIPTQEPAPAPPQPPPPPEPKAPDTRGLKAGRDLTIPADALKNGDLSFMEGLWQLGEGRLVTYDGKPDNVTGSFRRTLRFNKDGSGENYGTERKAFEKPIEDCAGGLQARTDGTTVFIDVRKCSAASGTLNGSKLECRANRSGKTICEVLNDDGHRYRVPLRRLQ